MHELRETVDSLITIPNEKLLAVLGERASMLEAFSAANDVLLGAVQGIADLIIRPGMINVDFADVRTVMSEMGMAMMGTGHGTGETRARDAAEAAVQSPLLDDINLAGAKGILVNITAGLDLSIGEFDEVGNTVREFADEDATVVVGTVIDPEMQGELRVTVVATGLGGARVAAPELRVVDHRSQEVQPMDLAAGDTVQSGPVDYSQYDTPTSIRSNPRDAKKYVDAAKDQDMDYLDIPAFLRRQAD